MKNIRLRAPRIINDVVRYPTEGVIPVDDALADQLIEDKAADSADTAPEDDGLEAMKLPQLRELAEREQATIEGDANKPTIIQSIRAKRAGAGG